MNESPVVELAWLESFADRMQLRTVLLDQLTATLRLARELQELLERLERMPG